MQIEANEQEEVMNENIRITAPLPTYALRNRTLCRIRFRTELWGQSSIEQKKDAVTSTNWSWLQRKACDNVTSRLV